MAVNDIPIWERWLTKHATEYDGFQYDVRVGRGRPAPPGFPPEFKKDIQDLTRLRIDAVGIVGPAADLIEVKQTAGASALGQILTYKELYQDEPGARAVRQMLIVTDNPHPDLLSAARKLNVLVETV
jgi:hypothetical protein